MITELERMLAGELYNANEAQLVEMRHKARRLLSKYNMTSYENLEEKISILKKLFGKVHDNTDIQAPFYCDYGVHIFAGKNLFINFNCTILDCATVTFGDNVLIAPNVQIYTAYHPIIASERIKGPELAAPIVIGNNVWIGGGAIICPGVTIGDNTTIGAGSVVTRDIPSHVVAAGNPCRIIKEV